MSAEDRARLTEAEQDALTDVLGAELYEALMEASADQWRRWRYLTDFAKEQYRAEAERIILGAFMPAVERILSDRAARDAGLAAAVREVLNEWKAATTLGGDGRLDLDTSPAVWRDRIAALLDADHSDALRRRDADVLAATGGPQDRDCAKWLRARAAAEDGGQP